jgi:hypothetical protein
MNLSRETSAGCTQKEEQKPDQPLEEKEKPAEKPSGSSKGIWVAYIR